MELTSKAWSKTHALDNQRMKFADFGKGMVG